VHNWIFHPEGGTLRDEISSHARGLMRNPVLSTEGVTVQCTITSVEVKCRDITGEVLCWESRSSA
jgi:hypothetical protein